MEEELYNLMSEYENLILKISNNTKYRFSVWNVTEMSKEKFM